MRGGLFFCFLFLDALMRQAFFLYATFLWVKLMVTVSSRR